MLLQSNESIIIRRSSLRAQNTVRHPMTNGTGSAREKRRIVGWVEKVINRK